MPNLEIMVEIGNYLGFAVTPMSMTEVFSALEQGVIDGQENPPSTIRSQAGMKFRTICWSPIMCLRVSSCA